ncbi:MAG: hypothetical protein ACT4P3_10960 [Betaproteobacteria bacterium]
MKRLGLLLTVTEPPPHMEEEFNAWYDTEHLAERLAIPGFRSARRWVADCKPGDGKYLATYELDGPEVLTSKAYLSCFENQTPWSRRCLGKTVVFRRWACEQLEPGDAGPHPQARAVAYGTSELSLPGCLQKRRFRAASGETITLLELGDERVSLPEKVLLYRAYAA